jgi:hypothetical protein
MLLRDWRNGDHGALDELMPRVYAELHRLAVGYMRTLTECWTGHPSSASYTFDVMDPAKSVVISEGRDGATLVRKSHRLRKHENDRAASIVETTNFETAERRTGRAPKPSFEDLYPDVKSLMEKRGWIPKS